MPFFVVAQAVMAANKLNVLHLHASDYCRFGVESKLFPNLTKALTGIKAGFYKQVTPSTLYPRSHYFKPTGIV